MNGIYKIEQEKIKQVALRAIKKVIFILLIVMVIGTIPAMQLMAREGKPENHIPSMLYSYFFTIPVFGLILWLAYKNLIKHFSGPLLEINDNGIYKWNSGKNPNVFISWAEITSIEEKKHSLLIKTSKASGWSGTGLIDIPKELEGYETVKNTINLKAGRA
ncbi:hypothetical protein SAMN05216464_11693 [Mucilaginibacter pineti]|uniref:Uncharacterized protein n=1 Tax=Mucilaginibacter pineti TaxID=1391627 RepID=A0A1G7KDY5_9SPHI|nr:hypothetical protein [Mucilaginibacter pineti]SDF35413.1 hypothetical protein SAMN05216464_11693 [Mucilaginibacter pineti]